MNLQTITYQEATTYEDDEQERSVSDVKEEDDTDEDDKVDCEALDKLREKGFKEDEDEYVNALEYQMPTREDYEDAAYLEILEYISILFGEREICPEIIALFESMDWDEPEVNLYARNRNLYDIMEESEDGEDELEQPDQAIIRISEGNTTIDIDLEEVASNASAIDMAAVSFPPSLTPVPTHTASSTNQMMANRNLFQTGPLVIQYGGSNHVQDHFGAWVLERDMAPRPRAPPPDQRSPVTTPINFTHTNVDRRFTHPRVAYLVPRGLPEGTIYDEGLHLFIEPSGDVTWPLDDSFNPGSQEEIEVGKLSRDKAWNNPTPFWQSQPRSRPKL